MITQDLGIATAYGYAKSKGYTGTEAEFAELMASYASTAQTAIEAADRAVEANTAAQSAKTDAAASKTAAQTAAQTATTKASEASQSASTATAKASEASESASTASAAALSASTSAQTATTAAATATTKADEAAASETAALSAKTDAESARDAAAQSARQAAASAESIDPDEFDRKIYAAFATDTASGTIASFTDGADGIPMKDVLVHIEPVQEGSGDPSPDNVRPITGWTGAKVTRCGKNLLNPSDPDYGNYTIGPDGTISTDGRRIATGFIPCVEGVSMTFSTNVKLDYVGTDVHFAFAGIAAYDKNKNFITRETVNNQRAITITTPAETAYVRAFEQITLTEAPTTLTPADFARYKQQLELGSTATDYEPYSGQTYSITFPTEAGTVYGGTLDVTKGELVMDRVGVTLDGSNITVNGKTDYDKYIRGIFSYNAKLPTARYNGTNTYILADKLTPDYNYTVGINTSQTASGFWVYPHSSGLFITMVRTDYPTIVSINAWLAENTPTVCYELATPITYTLTQQEITSLLGTNNLWADTGNSEVEYRANTELYITKKITEAVSALS